MGRWGNIRSDEPLFCDCEYLEIIYADGGYVSIPFYSQSTRRIPFVHKDQPSLSIKSPTMRCATNHGLARFVSCEHEAHSSRVQIKYSVLPSYCKQHILSYTSHLFEHDQSLTVDKYKPAHHLGGGVNALNEWGARFHEWKFEI